MFRNDRQSGVGGGVLLYIHQDLAAVPCKELDLITHYGIQFPYPKMASYWLGYCTGPHLLPLKTPTAAINYK